MLRYLLSYKCISGNSISWEVEGSKNRLERMQNQANCFALVCSRTCFLKEHMFTQHTGKNNISSKQTCSFFSSSEQIQAESTQPTTKPIETLRHKTSHRTQANKRTEHHTSTNTTTKEKHTKHKCKTTTKVKNNKTKNQPASKRNKRYN